MKKKSLTLLLSLIFSLALFSNNKGSKEKDAANTIQIAGKIIDKSTGEALPGVKIKIENTNFETYTDFDGNFSFNEVYKGEYNITADYISYSTVTLSQYKLDENNNEIVIELEEK